MKILIPRIGGYVILIRVCCASYDISDFIFAIFILLFSHIEQVELSDTVPQNLESEGIIICFFV